MNEQDIKCISEKYDSCDCDTVLHFSFCNELGEIYNYFILNLFDGQKIAITSDNGGNGIDATNPRNSIYLFFKKELNFTKKDFSHLKFNGDCGKTVMILAKADDFYRI